MEAEHDQDDDAAQIGERQTGGRRGPRHGMGVPRSASATSLALANLRGVVILIVLGFHSMLQPQVDSGNRYRFSTVRPYDWRAFPIIDSHRFFGST